MFILKKYLTSLLFIAAGLCLKAQIVFNSSTTASGSGVSSLTFSKTIPAGNNRLLYVGVTVQDKNITSVKWNNVSLTQFAIGTRNSMRVAMYYLALGSSATPTTANVVVAIASRSDAFAGAADYTGVYQAVPFANPTIARAKSTTPSVTFTSSVGNLAISLLGDISATPNANGSGQTQYWTYTGSHSNRSTQKAGAASVTMSHTLSANEDWVMIGGTMQDNAVVTLPIELVDFTSTLGENSRVNLTWQTASETNNDYFELEGSEDGIHFSTISTIKSKSEKGTSFTVLNYEAVDASPLHGTRYYRLKQVDFSGDYTYSNIISITQHKEDGVSFVIFPNPNQGEFYVNVDGIENNHEVDVFIHDGKQSVVYTNKTDINSIRDKLFNIELKNTLKLGLYNVLFVLEGVTYHCHLIIQ